MGLYSWWKARGAEQEARAASARRISEIMEMSREDEEDQWHLLVQRQMNAPAERTLEEESTIVNTRSEGGAWEILGSAYKGHIARDQQIMVAQARRLFRFDPNAQASIYGMLDYLMGKGVTITPKSKDPRIWKLWRQFWTTPDNKMGIRQFEIFKRIFRDGETFLRFFTKDAAGQATPLTKVRFLDPIDVQRGATENDLLQTDKTNQGIVFDPDDAEKPLFYFMKDRINPGKEHKIDATEVIHIKFPVADMDQSRGESSMQAVMEMFTQYKGWLRNRIILNKLRTAIFAVRKIDIQSGQSVSALSQTLPASGRTQDGKKQNIKPGTMYTPPPGVDIEMRAPNINAADVKDDGRNMILQMAAGMRLPEYMYGDASNANFASTMMAESPFVKHIHYLQAYFEETVWRPLFRKVIEAAVTAGKLTAPVAEDIFAEPDMNDLAEGAKVPGGKPKRSASQKEGDAADADQPAGEPITESETEIFFGCDIEWPEVIHRDPKEQTESLVLARNEGWISDKTCAEKLGVDYAEEVRKQTMIEEEAERVGNPLLQHAKDQAAADAEAAAGAGQQDKVAAGAGGDE